MFVLASSLIKNFIKKYFTPEECIPLTNLPEKDPIKILGMDARTENVWGEDEIEVTLFFEVGEKLCELSIQNNGEFSTSLFWYEEYPKEKLEFKYSEKHSGFPEDNWNYYEKEAIEKFLPYLVELLKQ